jgi:prepilin signal peptidase PulO-like enzyme (type II secretory pathway)
MLDMFLFLSVFLLGAIVGSFLNCVIYRLETGGSFLKGRSFCPHCKKELAWFDLFPVFSFVFLGGKCRYCRQKISWQYPLVEMAAGTVFLLIFRLFFLDSEILPVDCLGLVYHWTISAFLIVIFVYDLKHYIIPDKVIYPAIIVSGVWYLASGILFGLYAGSEMLNTIYAASGAAAFFLFIVLLSRGKWMGVGDIKLAFLMGLILGWPGVLVALLAAFYIGAIIGSGLIILKKRRLESEIPFAPFLVVGTFLALFWENELIGWYQAVFLLE